MNIHLNVILLAGLLGASFAESKDIGVVTTTTDLQIKVLYENRGRVYLRKCDPVVPPPVTRDCSTTSAIYYLDTDTYLKALSYDVGSYEKTEKSLDLVNAMLSDAQDAANHGNQKAQSVVQRLTTIKTNLDKIFNIRRQLQAYQKDVTYYEFQDDFEKLLEPFKSNEAKPVYDENVSPPSGANTAPDTTTPPPPPSGANTAPDTTTPPPPPTSATPLPRDIEEMLGMNFISVHRQYYSLQETEVTRGQWKALMGTYPEEQNSCVPTVKQDNHPVSCVSQKDAEKFAAVMTERSERYIYRLPTAKEWAIAAGKIEGAVYARCERSQSSYPVKRFKAWNGLYDMAGNVAEWTSTKSEWSDTGLITRGGSWSFYPPASCGTISNGIETPDTIMNNLGFRLLRQP
jgi:hypothetical protein